MTDLKIPTDANLGCLSCKAVSGEKPISPGPPIHEGRHWLVDHAYPTALKGWLVIVTKRHVEALHDLAQDEFAELGELLGRTTRTLRNTLDYEKEYTMCFAEAEGFKHVHFHVVPKPYGLAPELRSARIFAMLNVDEHSPVPREEIASFCRELREQFA